MVGEEEAQITTGLNDIARALSYDLVHPMHTKIQANIISNGLSLFSSPPIPIFQGVVLPDDPNSFVAIPCHLDGMTSYQESLTME
ncbi:hypothetical protein [Absidia glauca]|uniref:Uncharacterized protein n=1 Tax=Absidia glauca TaxID=4829 RepID=A0A168MQ69_ABSGL|nr:hypothetical protein [Absidia glauca]